MERESLLNLYKMMLKIRLAEESLVSGILSGEIKTPCHLYTGEEAVAVGVASAVSKDDYFFSNHRGHGHYLAKGGNLDKMICEVFTKSAGCSDGRGGSMHLADSACGFLGSAPIVAGTISLAMGAALSAKIKNENRLAISFFGDGATGEGVLYECLNFAALKKLSMIFVCENNLYSTHLPVSETRPDVPIYKIAEPFGIKTVQVDGNDVLKVKEAADWAVDLCRKGEGPVFIEALTYRLRGHVGPDDNIQGEHTDIRPEKEVEEWKKRDPIANFGKYLLDNGFSGDDLEKAKEEIEAEIKAAHETAQKSKRPEGKELADNLFK